MRKMFSHNMGVGGGIIILYYQIFSIFRLFRFLFYLRFVKSPEVLFKNKSHFRIYH